MRYERLFPLGSGGMATVELALAKGPGGFNRLVVLKSMRRELAADTDAYRMFVQEARVSARLNHPNVVQVSEVLETSSGIALVMEYLDGASLSSVYRAANAALTLPMRLRITCEVLAGLHYAHELTNFQGEPLGIVHRDVSPQNVFITYDGRIKLLDFGIAKAADSFEQTRVGLVKGRIAYMPAEQLSGGPVDRRTDVYAAGCLLWEAIAGSRLWADQTERDIVRGVVRGKVPALSSRVKVAPELERIVNRALALDPNHRYATAEEMRVEIEGYLVATFAAVSGRDVGELLSTVSGDARENRRRAIANAVAAIEAMGEDSREKSVGPVGISSNPLSGPRLKPERDPEMPNSRSGRNTTASSTGRSTVARVAEFTDRGSNAAEARPRSRKMMLVLSIGAVVTVALGWLSQMGKARDERMVEAAPPAAPPPAAPAAPAVSGSTRALRVEVTPPDARIFVDELPAASNPAEVSVEAGTEHVVRVEREGYESSVRKVQVLDNNVKISVDLAERAPRESAVALTAAPQTGVRRTSALSRGGTTKPAPATKPATAATSAAPATLAASVTATPATPTAPATPATPAAPANNCDPPFFFSNGIKSYKPECL
jgi:serine/threonine-protein kinase